MSETTMDHEHAKAGSCCAPGCCDETPMPPQKASAPRGEEMVGQVRDRYARIATSGGGCGCGVSGEAVDEAEMARKIGYADEEIAGAADANLGLGCGAPLGFLALQAGETVLDLGSGPGLDAFLAARQVGTTGRVIGVDMTPAMLERARASAVRHGLPQVEFREGRLERLPVVDASVDAVTSNCVINLVPDKAAVFAEIARVLKPGGRLVVSDIVLDGPLPASVEADVYSYVGCISGAALRDVYFGQLRAAGLSGVEILKDVDYLAVVRETAPAETDELLARNGVAWEHVKGRVRSLTFRARKAQMA